VINPKKRKAPWEDVKVHRASNALLKAKAANRRYPTAATCKTVDEASRALAQQYTDNRRKCIEQQLNNINSADESRKPMKFGRSLTTCLAEKPSQQLKLRQKTPSIESGASNLRNS